MALQQKSTVVEEQHEQAWLGLKYPGLALLCLFISDERQEELELPAMPASQQGSRRTMLSTSSSRASFFPLSQDFFKIAKNQVILFPGPLTGGNFLNSRERELDGEKPLIFQFSKLAQYR